jgi:hypothetical protein
LKTANTAAGDAAVYGFCAMAAFKARCQGKKAQVEDASLRPLPGCFPRMGRMVGRPLLHRRNFCDKSP